MTPNSSWPDAREIQVTFTSGVTDVYGRPLAQSVTSRFRTVDLSAPVVKATLPANGAIQVAFDSAVVVTFNEDLDPALGAGGPISVSGPLGVVSGNSVSPQPTSIGSMIS